MRTTAGRRVRHHTPPSRPRPDGERGESLVEILMTVVLLGVAITAILTTLVTVVISSHANRRGVMAANEATALAEAIERAPYVPCTGDPDTAYRNAAIGAATAAGFAIPQVTVRHLQSKTATTAAFGACPGTDQGVQEVRIEVSSPGGRYVVSTDLVLVKRDDACPTDPDAMAALGLAAGDLC